MMYNTTIYQNENPFEMDLCNLLQTMNLDSSARDASKYASSELPTMVGLNLQDDPMDEANYHSDGGSDYSSSSSGSNVSNNNDNLGLSSNEPVVAQETISTNPGEVFGCAYLQAIRHQLDSYPTTGGEYLDAIFTHREIFSTFPGAHRECARAFTDLAYSIEQRAWRADRDADLDAVTAFRHEAWMIASSL